MPQPGIVTSGLVFEHHGARWHEGTTHGVNSPLTASLTDTSGNGHTATLSGTAGTAASGYTGTGVLGDPYALTCDGSDYAALADLGISEDKVFSFEAWFRTEVAAVQYIVYEAGTTSRATLRVRSTGIVTGQLTDDAGVQVLCGGARVDDGLWHHGVFTCDGSLMTVYADGVAGTPVAVPSGTLTQTLTRLANNLTGLTGSLAVARAYSVALSAADVAQNFAAGYLWPHEWLPGSTAVPATRHVIQAGSVAIPVVS